MNAERITNPCPKCGYEIEAEHLPCCVDCHVANLDQQEAESAAYAIRLAEGDECCATEEEVLESEMQAIGHDAPTEYDLA